MPGRARPASRLRIERLWRGDLTTREALLWMPLTPLAVGYGAAMAARAAFWRLPGLRRRFAGLKIIGVGNLTVGGNAKTPFSLYLAGLLHRCGLRAAVVSRGYGGSKGGGAAMLVSDGQRTLLSPEEAGDEAVMMAKSFDGPVAIARRRAKAIALLQASTPLDAVVLDDAFQHLRLARDVNLLLVSRERGFGNRWTLPAGPMRERLGAIGRADAVVVLSSLSGADAQAHADLRLLEGRPQLHGVVRPRAVVFAEAGRWRAAPLETLAGARVIAVSGVADARPFYDMLYSLDADLRGVLEYPDHYAYTAADWQDIMRAATEADLVVTTEKDLVKLERFPFARASIGALRLEVVMGGDEQRLLEIIDGGAAARGNAA